MKDHFSLIAAAAGGFMLSVALSGILRGAPVVSLYEQPSLKSSQMANLQITAINSDELVNDSILDIH